MYRFWPGFERPYLTFARDTEPPSQRHGLSTSASLQHTRDRGVGEQSPGMPSRAFLDAHHELGPPFPGLRPSSASPTKAGRSTDAVVQGLRLLGMSAREARMYLAFLGGPLSAREGAEVAGLHRATGYRVLLRLLDRGLIVSDGRTPRRFRAVEPSALFRRLELFYRDETEIPSSLAEALRSESNQFVEGHFPAAGAADAPRILAAEGRSTHPALLELSQARRAVAAIVRPLSTPVGYRNSLARTLGHLARNGVSIRLITDAMPADYRFSRAVLREAGGSAAPIQVRHYCPIASQLYSIDRQTMVRIPALGTSSRTPPVGVAIIDRARVQVLVNRFESIWTEAAGAPRNLETGRDPARSGPSPAAHVPGGR
jgi:hypothetical protein